MLVLTRKKRQRIRIADNIEVVVIDIRRGKVRIGIECPREVPVTRAELLERTPPAAEAGYATSHG